MTTFALQRDDTVYSYDENEDENEYMQYTLNLGADSDCGSACPTPPRQLPPKAPRFDLAVHRPQEGDCGICLERAVNPVRPRCCSRVFCAEHIAAWLDSAVSSSTCPACAPTPSQNPPSSTCSTSSGPPSPPSESEEEDATDYSFPALQHARALQSRRHAPHPLSSVLGLRAGLVSLLRVLGCVVVVAVLAGSGRWGPGLPSPA
ncbi:hypothetical protein DFH09DRAFT_158304 [Mycena vulgaris]|nr:hypothetical protein DFH09DRAFT_158304 [Mycena vulgaris]